MGTEGQGIKPGTQIYSEYALVVPYGLGYRIRLNSKESIGIDAGFRATFTDYLDDVSTVYFDNNTLIQQRGALAAALANPAKGDNPIVSQTNARRGNPNSNDKYGLFTITYNRALGGWKEKRFRTKKNCYDW